MDIKFNMQITCQFAELDFLACVFKQTFLVELYGWSDSYEKSKKLEFNSLKKKRTEARSCLLIVTYLLGKGCYMPVILIC